MTIIGQALDTYARGIANFTEEQMSDRMTTVGASEIGMCARKVFWTKNEGSNFGVERDADYKDTWGARMRGTVFENRFWVPAMRARFGRRLLWAGRHQKRLEHLYLSATPDALLIYLTPAEQKEIGDTEANCALAECKTVDPRTNLTNPKEENRYQTIVQLGLVRQTTKWKPTHAIISYADASFWGDVKEFVIEFDPTVYANAQARAEQIMTAENVREMPPEGWIAGGHECRYCPFTKACGIERRNLPFAEEAEVDPQFKAEITDMVLALRYAESDRDRDEARVRQLQDELKGRLRDKGIRKIAGIVSWSAVKGRSGYDNKAVQAAAVAAGIDISQYATQGEPTDRLTLLIGRDDA